MPNMMAAQPNTICKSSVTPFLVACHKFWPMPPECRAVMLPIQENARLGRKVNFAPGKIPSGGKSHQRCIYSVSAQETTKHHARFGSPPVSDVTAVMKQRREMRWNLLGCPKLANRSQPLMDRSSPYSGDISRRYCCLTSFSDCRLSCKDIAPQFAWWCTDGDSLRKWCVLYFQRAVCSTFQTWILNSH